MKKIILFLIVFGGLILAGMLFFFLHSATNLIRGMGDLDCASYHLEKMDESNTNYHLCSDDECKEYFESKVEIHRKKFRSCLGISPEDAKEVVNE